MSCILSRVRLLIREVNINPFYSRNFFTNEFNRGAAYEEGFARLFVYFMPGNNKPTIQIMCDTDPSKLIGFYLQFPSLGESSFKMARKKLEAMIKGSTLDNILSFIEDRVYFHTNLLTGNEVREFLGQIPWVQDGIRSAMMDFSNTEKGILFKAMFHKDFLTVSGKCNSSVFSIIGKKGKSIGSAFAFCFELGTHGILTAKHCLTNIKGVVNLQTASGKLFQCHIKKIFSSKIDLALLEPVGDIPFKYGFSLGEYVKCEIGDRVYCAGYPNKLGISPTISLGHISNTNAKYKNELELLQISGLAINPANSGGPVLNSNEEVIGVLTGRGLGSDHLQNIAFCEPISRILNM